MPSASPRVRPVGCSNSGGADLPPRRFGCGLLSTTDSWCQVARSPGKPHHRESSERAIALSASGVIHVADPNHEIERQRSVNIVHLKALEFGGTQAERQVSAEARRPLLNVVLMVPWRMIVSRQELSSAWRVYRNRSVISRRVGASEVSAAS
jgi:hypothetical protein